MQIGFKKVMSVSGVACVILAGMAMLTNDHADPPTLMKQAPDGFSRYITMMPTGQFDPNTPNPDVPGCFHFFCDGDYFQQHVMERTPSQAAVQEKDAKHFFYARFGIDVDDPAMVGRVFFRSFYQDPRVNKRVYVVSGRKVLSGGWEVRDGGYIIFFLDLAGVPLGNEFTGQTAPAGSFVVYGEYNILEKYGWRRFRESIISYRSGSLVGISELNGQVAFSCELHAGRLDEIGIWADLSTPAQGRALGVVDAAIVIDNELRSSYRNTLTSECVNRNETLIYFN